VRLRGGRLPPGDKATWTERTSEPRERPQPTGAPGSPPRTRMACQSNPSAGWRPGAIRPIRGRTRGVPVARGGRQL